MFQKILQANSCISVKTIVGFKKIEMKFVNFFKHLLPRIDPPHTQNTNSFDVAFTVSDESFGLLVLDN